MRLAIYNAFEESLWEFLTSKPVELVLADQSFRVEMSILVDLMALLYTATEVITDIAGFI